MRVAPGDTPSVPSIDKPSPVTTTGSVVEAFTSEMRFEPDIFGPWGNAALQDREDLVLSAEVENLTYPNGAELIRTFVVQGDDPTFRIKTLKRRKTEAQAELEALQSKGGQS